MSGTLNKPGRPRPLNPPRYHSTDAVPQVKREVPPPRSHSPSPSVNSNRSSLRKPVPAYDSEEAPPLPSPSAEQRGSTSSTASSTVTLSTGGPRPTNPNPFAIPPSKSAPQTRPQTPSPTDTEGDDFPVLNFGRRPSAIDPLAPSFASRENVGGPASRQLVGGGLPSPTRASNQASAAAAAQAAARPTSAGHGRRQSHSRNPSISLPGTNSGSPTSSPLPSPTSASTPGGKILPLQPVPTRTRAPMEAFASVDMLQGQREHADRMRGSEVFGRDGKYEGRASLSGASGEGAHVRCSCLSVSFFSFSSVRELTLFRRDSTTSAVRTPPRMCAPPEGRTV